MRHKILISTLLMMLLLFTGCGLLGGGDEPETAEEETAEETPPEEVVIDLPTPTPLPADPGQEEMMSLLEGPEPVSALPEEPEAARAVQMTRFSAGPYSFVPPAGWEAVELGDDLLVVRRSGDDLFAGPYNHAPYIYLRPVKADTALDTDTLLDRLDQTILANLAGVQTTEPPQGIIIDGLKGVWQFAEGRNDMGQFRAFLMAIPAGGGNVLLVVVWGPAAEWETLAPEMANVLETMRFPASH